MKEKYFRWVTTDGRELSLLEVEPEHLLNIKKHLESRAKSLAKKIREVNTILEVRGISEFEQDHWAEFFGQLSEYEAAHLMDKDQPQ